MSVKHYGNDDDDDHYKMSCDGFDVDWRGNEDGPDCTGSVTVFQGSCGRVQ